MRTARAGLAELDDIDCIATIQGLAEAIVAAADQRLTALTADDFNSLNQE